MDPDSGGRSLESVYANRVAVELKQSASDVVRILNARLAKLKEREEEYRSELGKEETTSAPPEGGLHPELEEFNRKAAESVRRWRELVLKTIENTTTLIEHGIGVAQTLGDHRIRISWKSQAQWWICEVAGMFFRLVVSVVALGTLIPYALQSFVPGVVASVLLGLFMFWLGTRWDRWLQRKLEPTCRRNVHSVLSQVADSLWTRHTTLLEMLSTASESWADDPPAEDVRPPQRTTGGGAE